MTGAVRAELQGQGNQPLLVQGQECLCYKALPEGSTLALLWVQGQQRDGQAQNHCPLDRGSLDGALTELTEQIVPREHPEASGPSWERVQEFQAHGETCESRRRVRASKGARETCSTLWSAPTGPSFGAAP